MATRRNVLISVDPKPSFDFSQPPSASNNWKKLCLCRSSGSLGEFAPHDEQPHPKLSHPHDELPHPHAELAQPHEGLAQPQEELAQSSHPHGALSQETSHDVSHDVSHDDAQGIQVELVSQQPSEQLEATWQLEQVFGFDMQLRHAADADSATASSASNNQNQFRRGFTAYAPRSYQIPNLPMIAIPGGVMNRKSLKPRLLCKLRH